MDIADATLVVTAEKTGIKKILTLDSDFLFYRISNKESFEVLLYKQIFSVLRDKQGAIADLQEAARLFQRKGNVEMYNNTQDLLNRMR